MADKMIRHYGVSALAIAHCNFHLRGAESDADAAFVREFASNAGVKLHETDFDTRAFAAERGVSIEMAARELRYRWFDALCLEYGYDGVCVAHNANDNAETLLLNLVRGTGLKGLCGMAQESVNPYGTTPVLRPMLDWTRERIEAYAADHNLAFRTDSSNLSSEYKRNLIRNEVMPLLLRLNPSLIETLSRDIAHFRQAREIVDDWAETRFSREGLTPQESLVPPFRKGEGPIARWEGFFQEGCKPSRQGLRRIDIAALEQTAHWEYLLYDALSAYGFSSKIVDQVERLLKDENATVSGRRFESPEYTLVTSTNELIISPKADDAPSPEMPRVELLAWDSSMDPRTERGVILLDADALGGEPCLRLWQEGDWLRPIGLRGKKKVSDMLTDLKYNISEKENVYVVAGREPHHVLAVACERVDEEVKVTASSTRVYRISMS